MNREQRQQMFEGLAGHAQETLPPEEAKKAEDAVKAFLERNPTGYNLSYGSSSGDDTAYVGFNKSNDYSGHKPEVVFQTPYKFKRSLHAVASKVWQSHQDEQHSKKFPPQELNREDALKNFDAASKHIDWYHDYSDDHRVWSAGEDKKKAMNHAMQIASLADPDGAKEIVKRNFPRDNQEWALQSIDHINANRNKWSRIYKLS